MCTCVHVCMYVYVCYVRMYVCVCMLFRLLLLLLNTFCFVISSDVYLWACMHACVYVIQIVIFEFEDPSFCIYIYICIYMYVCMSTYKHICVCIYTWPHTHIKTWISTFIHLPQIYDRFGALFERGPAETMYPQTETHAYKHTFTYHRFGALFNRGPAAWASNSYSAQLFMYVYVYVYVYVHMLV
jgi:hypothetical protein